MSHTLPVHLINTCTQGPKTIAIACGSTIKVYSLQDGTPVPLNGDQHTAIVRSISFSADGTTFLSTADDKNIKVWHFEANAWVNIATKKIIKKPTLAMLSPTKPQTVIASDKFGDVFEFSYPIVDEKAEPSVILGHMSSITDMAFTEDNKFILTSDKDEKIRVSRYPFTAEIHSYCLGHKEFVSGFLISGDVVVSGSGDGSLIVWDWNKGLKLDMVAVGAENETVTPIGFFNNRIIAFVEGKPSIFVFELQGTKLKDSKPITYDLAAPVVTAYCDHAGHITVSVVSSSGSDANLHTLKLDSQTLAPHVDPVIQQILASKPFSTVDENTFKEVQQELSKFKQFRKNTCFKNEQETPEGEVADKRRGKKKQKVEAAVPTFVEKK